MLMVSMTRVLSELLGAGEPMFAIAMKQLERSSGNQSIDVKLTSDIIAKSHIGLRALGLDPRDTTGRELYGALQGLVALHDTFLARRLGADDPTDTRDMMQRIRVAAENVHMPRSAWVFKHSVAKRLLKATPPHKVMKALHYRSLDSMIKREPIDELFVAMRLIESEAWQKAFVAKYKNLTPLDFEVRDIEVIIMDETRWATLVETYVRSRHHNLTHLKELGVVALLPLPIKHLRGITISLFPRVLHYINEIRLYSAFFKLQQVRPQFGAVVAETINDDPGEHVTVAGNPLHWRIVHQHFAKNVTTLPEVFEPHVRMEDLEWRKAEAVLFELEPALQFWHNMDYVGALRDGQPVSFNLMDMAANYVNQLSYENRSVSAMRRSLWSEISLRYIAQPMLERQVIDQLDLSQESADLFKLSFGSRI